MNIGGVQKSLVNLLKQIREEYDITLLLFSDTGEMRRQIPAGIKVVTVQTPYRYLGMGKQDVKTIGDFLGRSVWAAMTKLFGRAAVCRGMGAFQRKTGTFDVAISFLHSGPQKMFYGGCNEFVLDRVEAKRKVTVLHCDYEQIRGDSKQNRRLYERFDGIAACSNGCRETFVRAMPQLADRITVVPNCQDYERLRALAAGDSCLPEGKRIHILTVARFGREKGIGRAVQAIAALDGSLCEFDYTVIGDGIEFQSVQEQVRELGLEQRVHLLGEKNDPYPEMADADLLLIPSVSEAAPMVIGEAACLGTPILTTRTSSAQEMVQQTGYGWVCENSVDGIREGLVQLLAQPGCLTEKRAWLKKQHFDNTEALERFRQFIGE